MRDEFILGLFGSNRTTAVFAALAPGAAASDRLRVCAEIPPPVREPSTHDQPALTTAVAATLRPPH